MKSAVRATLVAGVLLIFLIGIGSAQVISQPTPAPIVTADSEFWFLNGDPITYSGNLYYPAGAQVAFNSNEMVRSGFHFGVPLYVRSTDEPFSVVYVPLARGFMQPYMRRRTGDVAGTVGTAPPSGIAAAYSPAGLTVTMPQAAGPPTLVAGPPSDAMGQPRAPIPAIAARDPLVTDPIATSGGLAQSQGGSRTRRSSAAPEDPTHTRIGPRPRGINAVFVEFRDKRWYSEGPAVEFDPARMVKIADYRGFPVFADRAMPKQRIYITTTTGGTLVAPYSVRKAR